MNGKAECGVPIESDMLFVLVFESSCLSVVGTKRKLTVNGEGCKVNE